MTRALFIATLLLGCRAEEPTMKLVADDPQALDGPAHSRLQLGAARSLLARMHTSVLPAPITWVTVELIAPSGAVYTRRHLPYSADPSLKLVPSPDGVPHPIDVLPAHPSSGGWDLDLAFPVGGTNLQRRPQPGPWRVRAVLDARPEIALESSIELVL